MIEEIVSGGQTGADRAALDIALQHGIRHGGWIPKGRKAEDGPLPAKYRLKEMPTDSYADRTEQNVIDSDGTLIFSHGRPIGGTDYTREMVLKHRKQLLGIDLNQSRRLDAASLIASWISLRRIKKLNVAGPRASEDPHIYRDVFTTLEMVIQMLKRQASRPATALEPDIPASREASPKTVSEAVKRLLTGLTLKDKATIANMAENELDALKDRLGDYLQKEFNLWSENSDLLTSCGFFGKKDRVSPHEASSIIIRELWKHLQNSYRLRVIK